MSSGIRQAELVRRLRAVQVVGAAFSLAALTFVAWAAAAREWVFVGVLSAVAVGCLGLIAVARRGYVRLAGYALSTLLFVAVLLGSLAHGDPGYASFYLSLGVLIAAAILQPRDVAVIFVVGLVLEGLLASWQGGAETVSSLGGVNAEGALLYVVASVIALVSAASVARLIADLRKRDAEARQAAERSEALALQLEQAQRMEALARLSGGVAHDFNNLLTVMRGCATLLESAIKPGTEAQTDLKDLSDAVDRGAQLTRQLLAFSKRDVVQPAVFDLQEVLEGMRDLLQRMIGPDVQLKVEAANGPWTVWASLSQLEQVLMNLAINARDAMEGRGELRVRLERAADAQLGVACRLIVTDTGSGMTEQVRARIFEPFFTTKAPGKGTGLGLATSYGIISRLGGRIDVTSSLGKGATFSVSLPLASSGPSAAATPQASPLPVTRDVAVCVVDDEPLLRSQMARILGSAGLTVRTFASAEALLASPDHPCDVLVTDVNLPGMSGIELAEAACSKQPDLRVVLVSGYSGDPSSMSRLMQKGARFVPKPFDAAALLAAVTNSPAAP